jgi:hypothetical protein
MCKVSCRATRIFAGQLKKFILSDEYLNSVWLFTSTNYVKKKSPLKMRKSPSYLKLRGKSPPFSQISGENTVMQGTFM